MKSSSPVKCIDDGPLTDDFSKKLRFPEDDQEPVEEVEAGEDQEEEDEDDDDEEFSFAYVNAEGSPITAEEAFEDGHIRPAYPLFNRDLLFDYQNDGVSMTDDNNNETVRPRLRKLFVEDGDGKKAEEGSKLDPLGQYCSWSGGTTVEEASPESCRKSNSTGFSKLWRFRDLVLRSNSDGRDAFVFLNKTQSSSSSSSAAAAKLTSEDDKKPILEAEKKSTKGKDKTTSSSEKRAKSAHEKLYMRNRAMKEEGKRRSYLPYQQVGFFTNVNGLTRNIHPF
ncbi:hypothetical protein HA466_0247740 [Hirschfeldia incana]|nr:hypothetical protein HA466_0247740 [Hirschfeldia incana]